MQLLVSRDALRAELDRRRANGERVALVPTMGALHQGHLALVDVARREAECVVMSIFVNPLQFRPGEDFDRYPRRLEQDVVLAAARGVDIIFAPDVDEMYRAGRTMRVAAGEAAARWEGSHRPGHFDGVLTVVAKLFHQVAPDLACFGRKDFQQVTLIHRMVRELEFPLQVVVVPTQRDPDGLALSSRNTFLTAEERGDALALSRALRAMRAAWASGTTEGNALIDTGRAVLDTVAGVATDYLAVVDPIDLLPVARADSGTVILLAARVGTTRLIDNTILGDASA